jgi:hypothetical protein
MKNQGRIDYWRAKAKVCQVALENELAKPTEEQNQLAIDANVNRIINAYNSASLLALMGEE